VATFPSIVLASRSPRRLELLSLLVPADRIVVHPPANSDEPGFDDCRNVNDVEHRLRNIAAMKRRAVRNELRQRYAAVQSAILSADTTIVAESSAGEFAVLGQPPIEDRSRPVVRRWFEEFYFARSHLAMTAVSLEAPDGRVIDGVAATTVHMNRAKADWLDWYLSTAEPDGKAGGYAIQGLASVFIDRIEGSLSNVIGLPLEETREMLLGLDLIDPASR